MKPYRIDKDVQSNVEPVVSFYADYVRNPINIKSEKRDYMGIEETVYVYDEELYTLGEWVSDNGEMEILSSEVEALKAENKLLNAQVEALSATTDFQEDCLTEMAMIVYA